MLELGLILACPLLDLVGVQPARHVVSGGREPAGRRAGEVHDAVEARERAEVDPPARVGADDDPVERVLVEERDTGSTEPKTSRFAELLRISRVLKRPIQNPAIFLMNSANKRRERWTAELNSDPVLLGSNTLIVHAVSTPGDVSSV